MGRGAATAGLTLALCLGCVACGPEGAAPRRRSPALFIRGVGPVGPVPRLEWPVSSPVSSQFGRRGGRAHEGIDLLVPEGTPVLAAASGQVIYASDELRGYGNLLVLRHDAHHSTVYAHNSRLLVKEGQTVQAGQVIALSGKTGRVTAPHVHFELRVDGVAIDPQPFLPPPAR